jgi:mycothiol S-conjugate amidase
VAAVPKKLSSVSGTVGAAEVLTLPFWLGSAGRSTRPSCLQPAATEASATSTVGRATSRRTTSEPTLRLRSIAFMPVKERLCLLTVHAHPDDEASKGAPTMAMYKAEGVHTVLVCCTGGEEGDLQNPALREPGQPFHGLSADEEKRRLAELRPDELLRSAEIIGFDEVVMLGYRDSGMVDTDPNEHPESFHQAPLDEAAGRLVGVIRAQRADVLITYGDDQSGYPHPDHLKVHDISLLAWERAGDPAWYPEHGEPYRPQKLYYSVWSKARLVAVHEAMIELRGESPFDKDWLARPGHDDRITTRLDVGNFLWARSGALRAHATQVDPTEPWWFGLTDEELADIYPWEDWILARSLVGIPAAGELETDLFAGIRTSVSS